jgi:hypothetical protein
MTRRNARPFIALVAAYALALQAIFAGVVLGARSAEAALFASAGLCLTGETQGDHQSSDRMPCCTLTACCAGVSDVAAAPGVPVLLLECGNAVALLDADATRTGTLWLEAHQPRGPPAA